VYDCNILYFSILDTTGMSHLKNGVVFFTCITISSLVGRRVLSILVSEVSVQYRTHFSAYKTGIESIRPVSKTLFYLQDFYRKCRYSAEHNLLPTGLLLLIHVKHTLPYLYTQPSSWRWTLGFETCRRYQKLKINLEKVHFVGLYCIIIAGFSSRAV